MKEILDFLSELKDHNTREWMEANKKTYHYARDSFKDVVKDVLQGISKFDPSVDGLEPKDCIFRLNRDIRFSKDKSPYKLNFGAAMGRGGRKSEYAGYYLHVMPGNNFIGGGIYMPQAEVLRKIRQEIDYNAEDLLKVIADKNFKKVFGDIQGDALKTAPKGYPKDHPHINLIKQKSFIFLNTVSDSEVKKSDFVESTAAKYQTLKPFLDFLNTAMD